MPDISGHQFMPITQIMGLHSEDFGDVDTESLPKPATVHDVFSHVYTRRNRGEWGYDWDRLRHDIGKQGITKPVGVTRSGSFGGPSLVDGHHRAILAIEQGHMFVPVSEHDDPADYWAEPGRLESANANANAVGGTYRDLRRPLKGAPASSKKRASKQTPGQQRML